MNPKFLFATFCLSCLFSIRSKAAVIYVDSAHVGGTQTGANWATAFSDFQSGIDAANAGDSVWVAMGTYQPPLNSSFVMKEAVKLFGGFLNTDTSFAQRSSSIHVATLRSTGSRVINNNGNNLTLLAVIDGFTITNGMYIVNAGGIYNSGASPTIRNCIFSSNSTSGAQGGAAIYNSGHKTSISNCTFIGNSAYSKGGAIYNDGDSTYIGHCIFSDNGSFASSVASASPDYYSQGGAIFNNGNGIIITNCTFNNNVSYPQGGAIYNGGNNASMDSCVFNNNRTRSSFPPSTYSAPSYSYGGAIYNAGNAASVSNCVFSSNTASNSDYFYASPYSYGGAVYNKGLNTSIVNCVFSNNASRSSSPAYNIYYYNAYSYGGAIYNAALLNINGCTFYGNNALSDAVLSNSYSYGGAIYNASGLNMGNCTFNNNTAAATSNSSTNTYGGAIYDSAGVSTTIRIINHCLFTKNTAQTGGAIFNDRCKGIVEIKGSGFSRNSAINGSGGAIFNTTTNSGGLFNIEDCTFTGNVSKSSFSPFGTYKGGGIYNHDAGASITISNCAFAADSASAGAAIYNASSMPVITNCLFARNMATDFGGAVCNTASSPKLINCTMVQNNAGTEGGGIYNESNTIATISNTIVWGNYSGIYNDATSAVNMKYSLIQDYPATPASFLIAGTTDPLFADAATGNYQLQSNSPCINVGRNDSIPSGINTDLASHTRIYDGTVDIGAYEQGVFVPVVNLGFDTAVCASNTVTLNAQNTGATYLWNTGATTQTITVSASGTYYVTATNVMGNSSDTIVVTVNPLPLVNLGNDTAVCNGVVFNLDAQNQGATYLWSNNNTNRIVSITTGGIYYVSVTNAYQCNTKDTIVLAFNMPTVNLGNDTAICSGNSLTLDAQNPGAAYLWSNAAITQSIHINVAGTYVVEVTDTNGCKNSDTISVVVHALPVVDLGTDVTVTDPAYTINADNAGSTYLWNTGATTQTLTVTATGTYSVIVTNANDCSASDTIKVTFEPTGIKDVNVAGHLVKVIPNPAKDIIYIQTDDDKLINQLATLTDAYGRVLRTITIKSKSQELFLGHLAQGMYFLKIQTGETLKIVKE